MVAKANTDKIHALCQKCKISKDVEADLEIQVSYLRMFKTKILPASQTESQRAKAFQQIELLAAKLKQAIEGLTFGDRAALDDQFFFVGDIRVLDSTLELVEDPSVFDLAGSLIPRIEGAAKDVRGRLQGVGQPSRPKVTGRQAEYVMCIAKVLKRANITPAYSGPFFELCTAAFEDAGLTLPDRAIRHFMQKMRPNLKADGFCL